MVRPQSGLTDCSSLQIGNDIASLGAVYGTVISVSGDLIHMSIGQAPNSAVAPLDPKIPEMVVPGGLDIMHDSFESDVSPTREDKYRSVHGDASICPFLLSWTCTIARAAFPTIKSTTT